MRTKGTSKRFIKDKNGFILKVRCSYCGEYGDVGYSFGAHVHIDIFTADWSKKINPHSILLI